MLIGIVSDTHGLLRQEVIDGLKGVDHIIHAGDIDNKAVIDRLEEIAPVTVVRGNADKEWAEGLPETAVLELLGNRIYVISGPGEFEFGKRVIDNAGQDSKLPRDIDRIISRAMDMTDRGKTQKEIAKKLKISEELAERICRMYLTHPGVDVAGILQRL